MTENDLARIVYQKGMDLHKALGPGLLEKVYEECLFRDLQKQVSRLFGRSQFRLITMEI